MDVSFSDLQLRGKATVEAWLGTSAGRPRWYAAAMPKT